LQEQASKHCFQVIQNLKLFANGWKVYIYYFGVLLHFTDCLFPEGVFDALTKKYLRMCIFAIFAGDTNKSSPIESYTCKFVLDSDL
jgi:hypothetical protein